MWQQEEPRVSPQRRHLRRLQLPPVRQPLPQASAAQGEGLTCLGDSPGCPSPWVASPQPTPCHRGAEHGEAVAGPWAPGVEFGGSQWHWDILIPVSAACFSLPETLPRAPLAQQQPAGPAGTGRGSHRRRAAAAPAARGGLAGFWEHGGLQHHSIVPAHGGPPATRHLRHVPHGLVRDGQGERAGLDPVGGAGFSSTWALGPRERVKWESQNLEIQGKIMASEAKI